MKYLYRAVEEVFPFLPFFVSRKKIKKLIDNNDELTAKSEVYKALDADCLNNRIKEEHERGIKIDDKTFKFTLGLSISLTVLAAASGSFAKYLPSNLFAEYISIACGFSALYMLAAGITALGALKTLPTYGYGTEHIINQKAGGVSYLSQALFAQERMNIVRHLRNEAAYQSLRNGFILLFFALAISVGTHINGQELPKLDSRNVGEQVNTKKNTVSKDRSKITAENINSPEEKPELTVAPPKKGND